MKYYAVPPYKGHESYKGHPHVLNEDGELVCVFEGCMEECDQFVKRMNDTRMVDKIDIRDYFAANAPDAPNQWLKDSLGDGDHVVNAICAWRFFYADAMMEARK